MEIKNVERMIKDYFKYEYINIVKFADINAIDGIDNKTNKFVAESFDEKIDYKDNQLFSANYKYIDDEDNVYYSRIIFRINGNRIDDVLEADFEFTDNKYLDSDKDMLRKYNSNKNGNECLICGRDLKDPISMARGIGPECIKKNSS